MCPACSTAWNTESHPSGHVLHSLFSQYAPSHTVDIQAQNPTKILLYKLPLVILLAKMLPASPRTVVQGSVTQPALFSACYITLAVHAIFSESSSLQRYVPSSSDCPFAFSSGLTLVIAASLQLTSYLASDTCYSVDATRHLSFTPRSCLLPQWLSCSFTSIPCSWHNCLAPAAHAS